MCILWLGEEILTSQWPRFPLKSRSSVLLSWVYGVTWCFSCRLNVGRWTVREGDWNAVVAKMLLVIYKIDRIHGRLNAWIHRHKHSLETDGGSKKWYGRKNDGWGHLYKLINILMLKILFCSGISELVFKN